jgi:hypothetical protein
MLFKWYPAERQALKSVFKAKKSEARAVWWPQRAEIIH